MEPSGETSAAAAVVGDFDAADELLFAADTGGLPGLGPVRVQRSGQIGPLVELVRAPAIP